MPSLFSSSRPIRIGRIRLSEIRFGLVCSVTFSIVSFKFSLLRIGIVQLKIFVEYYNFFSQIIIIIYVTIDAKIDVIYFYIQ